MKIKLQRSNINRYSGGFSQISVQKNSMNSVVENLMIETMEDGGKQFIEILSTNYETFFRVRIPAEFDGHGKICINAHRFLYIIREIQDNTFEMEFDEKRLWVQIKSGELKFKLSGLDTNLFPKPEWEDLKEGFKMSVKDLKNALKKSIDSVPDHAIQNYLKGIGVSYIDDSVLEFSGSDSMKISRSLYPVRQKNFEKLSFIVPKKSAQEIINILDREEGECDVLFDRKNIQIRLFGLTYQSKLLNDKYPNIQRIFDMECSSVLRVNREELTRFLRIVKGVAENTQKSVKIIFHEDFIELIGEKTEHTEGNFKIQCYFEGSIDFIGFNVDILYNGLQCFSESNEDEITMKLKSSRDPCILCVEDMKNYMHLCMPMNISW